MAERINIIQFVEDCTRKYASHPFIYEKEGAEWRPTSYSRTLEEARELGAGLIVEGVEKGTRVALLSEGRKDWITGELGILFAGAVNVPLSVKLDQKSDLLFRLTHSGAQYVMVSKGQLSKVRTIRPQCPELKKIIVFDHIENLAEDEIYIGDIFQKGIDAINYNPDQLRLRTESIKPDDLATISYTSGTVADPKGVMLTHRNITANIAQTHNSITYPEGSRMLIILPLDHCFAHVAGFYLCMSYGCSIGMIPGGNLRNIASSIHEFQPNIMLSVPTITRNFKKQIDSLASQKSIPGKFIYNFCLDLAEKYYREGYNKGGFRDSWEKPIVKLADKFIFRPMREKVFGRGMKFFVSGAAYLDMPQQKFYYAIGVPIMQGYGLSEATPIVSANDLARKHILGTCGKAVSPMQIEIRDENDMPLPEGQSGEICIRGENVMAGYWKNPEATARVIRDGWLHTGDMGYLTEGDFVCVTGRFKSLLISADGEKYSPEQIEEVIVSNSKYISQIMLYNSQSPYTIALVYPDKDNLMAYLAKLYPGIDPASEKGRKLMLERIQSVIDSYKVGQVNYGAFPDRWLPAAIIVIPEPFSTKNGQINASAKLKRRAVEKAYAEAMAFAFTPAGKNITNAKNLAALK